MTLLELGNQLVTVGAVEVNQRRFQLPPVHLAQAPAGGLQYHVLGAVPLLGEDNSGQTAAVPALFANLHQQDNTDF